VGATHIAVYDLQGRMVELLVDKEALPGQYRVTWKGLGQAPGIYFCVIKSGAYSITKKLVLTGL